jgi:hypothetical protein
MRLCFALLAMLLFVHAAPAAEQKRPLASDTLKPPQQRDVASPITDRFALRVLYFPASISTDLRLDQQNGLQGTELIAEDDLGLSDSKSQGRAEMIIRLRDRNRLRVDYMKVSRLGDRIIDRVINFGDETFRVNDRALTGLEWRSLTLTYTRSLLYTDRFEAGVGLGISILEARARGEITARNIRERQEAVGAFPTFAVDGTWRISKRWSLNARAQRFNTNIDEFQGSLGDYHADVQYRWQRNFAVGLGYSRYHTVVDVGNDNGSVSDNDLTGRFDQEIRGPEVFLRASF